MEEWAAELIVGGAALIAAAIGFAFRFQSKVSSTVARADTTVQNLDHQMDMMMQEQIAGREKMSANFRDLYTRVEEVKGEVHEVKEDVAFIKGHLDH